MNKYHKIAIFLFLSILFLNQVLAANKFKDDSYKLFILTYFLNSIENINKILTNINKFLVSLIIVNQIPTTSVSVKPLIVSPEAVPLPPDDTKTPPVENLSGNIEGYVYGKTSTTTLPLPNAKVKINDLGLTTYTDKKGYYVFENIPYGFHVLTAEAKDYYPDSKQVKLESNKIFVDFLLYSTQNPSLRGIIEGYVKSKETKQPISGAKVEINDYKGERKITYTNTEGYYRFNNIYYGEYKITAEATGYLITETKIILSSPRLRQDLFLESEKKGTIRGTIEDKYSRQPIKDAIVSLYLDLSYKKSLIRQTLTDMFGGYIFKFLNYDKYEIHVEKEGYKGANSSLILNQPLAIRNFYIEPLKKGSISGRVIDKNSKEAIKNAVVSLEGPVSKVQNTNYNGEYMFEDIEEGSYKITASAKNYVSSTKEVNFKLQDTLTVNFELERTYLTFFGNISDREGKPIEEALVEVYLKNILTGEEFKEGSNFSDKDGNYKIVTSILFHPLVLKDYRAVIIVYRDGYKKEKKEVFITSVFIRTDFVLDKSSKAIIRGKILDQMSKNPLEGAKVYTSLKSTYSNQEGQYEIETVSGYDIVSVWHPDYFEQSKEVYVPPEGLDNVDFYLKKIGFDLINFVIYVFDKDTNKPLEGASVKIFEKQCLTGIDGKCEINNVVFYKNGKENTYTFQISKTGYKPLIENVTINPEMIKNSNTIALVFKLENEKFCNYSNLEVIFKNSLNHQILDLDFLIIITDLEKNEIIYSYKTRKQGFFEITIPFDSNKQYRNLKISVLNKEFKIKEFIINLKRCENKEIIVELEYAFYKELYVDGVKFCIYGQNAEKYLQINSFEPLKKLSSKFKEKSLKTGISNLDCINIFEQEVEYLSNAYAYDNKVLIDLAIRNFIDLTHIFSHELGHIYDIQHNHISNKEKFKSYYDKSKLLGNCVFDKIDDSSFDNSPRRIGHPQDGSFELFASAFHAFNDHREEFLRRVNSAPDSKENSCQDILRKIYNFMENEVFNSRSVDYKINKINKYLSFYFNKMFNLFKKETNAQNILSYGSVYGILTDINNKPIKDARVYIGTKYFATTNNDGYFEIKNIPAGLYPFFVFDKNGYRLKDDRISLTIVVSPYEPLFLILKGFYRVNSGVSPF